MCHHMLFNCAQYCETLKYKVSVHNRSCPDRPKFYRIVLKSCALVSILSSTASQFVIFVDDVLCNYVTTVKCSLCVSTKT